MKTEISTVFNYFFKFSYKSKLLEIYKHGLLIVLSPMSRMNDRNGVFGPNDFPKKNILKRWDVLIYQFRQENIHQFI